MYQDCIQTHSVGMRMMYAHKYIPPPQARVVLGCGMCLAAPPVVISMGRRRPPVVHKMRSCVGLPPVKECSSVACGLTHAPTANVGGRIASWARRRKCDSDIGVLPSGINGVPPVSASADTRNLRQRHAAPVLSGCCARGGTKSAVLQFSSINGYRILRMNTYLIVAHAPAGPVFAVSQRIRQRQLGRRLIQLLSRVVDQQGTSPPSSKDMVHLVTEAEQLRQVTAFSLVTLEQEVQILEENLHNSLAREENALDDEGPPGDTASLQRLMKNQKAKPEMGIEQLRKRLTDSEMKSAHVAHDLNKEISELEALIEPSWQIYREDELEQELERTKDKLRQRKSSKGSSEVVDAQRRSGSVAGSDVSDTEGVREICEKPGHDIFSCSLLSAGSLPDASS
ncbi:hypothetical protein B0H11DRAFT_1925810 [Mycena galericulata]|nr:hypothetical protein B0H11DRAFT_1925810 [Mycena galericulata]